MKPESKVTYIFYCGRDKSEYVFEIGTHLGEVSSEFNTWMFHIFGIDTDETEYMIAEGEAGYYEV